MGLTPVGKFLTLHYSAQQRATSSRKPSWIFPWSHRTTSALSHSFTYSDLSKPASVKGLKTLSGVLISLQDPKALVKPRPEEKPHGSLLSKCLMV